MKELGTRRLASALCALLSTSIAPVSGRQLRPVEMPNALFPASTANIAFTDASEKRIRLWCGGLRLERAELPQDRMSVDEAERSSIPLGVRMTPRGGAGGESVLETGFLRRAPFRECIVSWNVETPPGTGFVVEVRVGYSNWIGDGSPASVEEPSPWLCVGAWGTVPDRPALTEFTGGKVDVDFFRSERLHDSVQVRVRAFTDGTSPSASLRVERIVVCTSDVRGAAPEPGGNCTAPAPGRMPMHLSRRRLPVPARSQKIEAAAIASRICSPTSLAMVLAYHGVDRPTVELAERAYDPLHDLYGNWLRNVQAAFSYGVPGYVDRFTSWFDVEQAIARGMPLIVSLRAQKGELAGAPYEETSGHLIVVAGFDEQGNCLVNDPAAPDASSVERTYSRADLERVWMRKGGVAYVLMPPRK